MRKLVFATALVFALMTGSAWAGSRWLIASTTQIKPSVLRQLKGERGGRGPAGPRGAAGVQGPAGATGAQGPAGSSGAVTSTVVTAQTTISAAAYMTPANSTVTATCPAGAVAVGGFAEAYNADSSGGNAVPGALWTAQGRPTPSTNGATPTGWQAFLMEPDATPEGPAGNDITVVARGRDAGYPGAPRTDPSERNYRTGLLPWVRASKRRSGQGWAICRNGSHRFRKRCIRAHVSRVRWLRRRSDDRQSRTTSERKAYNAP
jgi:hypothetical protein